MITYFLFVRRSLRTINKNLLPFISPGRAYRGERMERTGREDGIRFGWSIDHEPDGKRFSRLFDTKLLSGTDIYNGEGSRSVPRKSMED